MVSLAKVDEDARKGRGPGSFVLAGCGVMRLPARLTGSTAASKIYVIQAARSLRAC